MLFDEGAFGPLCLQEPRLQLRGGQGGLQLAVEVPGGGAAGGALLRLVEVNGEPFVVISVILGPFVFLRLGDGLESHGLVLRDEDAEDLLGPFVHDLDTLGAGRTVFKQRVPQPEIQQFLPARLYRRANICPVMVHVIPRPTAFRVSKTIPTDGSLTPAPSNEVCILHQPV